MDPATDQANPTFSWRAHPARERPRRAAAGVVAIVVLAGCCGLLMQSGWWSLLSAVILIVALNRFFFPSRFSVDAAGIAARYPLGRKQLRWGDLRRFVHDRYGGHLSTRRQHSWIDAGRGMHLLFGPDPDPVIEQIRSRFESARSAGAEAHDDQTPANPVPHDRVQAGGGQWAH